VEQVGKRLTRRVRRTREYPGERVVFERMVFERWTLEEEPSSEPRYFYLCLPEGMPVELKDKPTEPPVAEAAEPTEFWVLGNSEKEARENAETIIDLVARLAYADVEKASQGIRLHRERIEKLEAEIPELERRREEIEREIEEHKKTVHYRNETDARRSILEWTDSLNGIEVDLIGIKAKLAKIEEIRQGLRGESDGVSDSLFTMQFAAEVELASALARKEAAQSFRKKAIDFVTLSTVTRRRVSRPLKSKQDELAYSRRAVPRYEEVLAKLQAANIQPLEVVDNEVVIHPVQ
jgi:chromosome segregation ATPase